MLASLFQSITPRTAGFNTVDIGLLTNETILMMILLMFVGASPGSTGGGVKTTSAGILFLLMWSRLRGREDVHVFNRTIPRELLNRTLSIILISIALRFSWSFRSCCSRPRTAGRPTESRHLFVEYLFETVSAFGTVGLSMNLTPDLSPLQKLAHHPDDVRRPGGTVDAGLFLARIDGRNAASRTRKKASWWDRRTLA